MHNSSSGGVCLKELEQRLAQYQPQRVEVDDYPQAAVLLALTQDINPQLILTQRAAHLNTHSGQVAFPGGKRDPEDTSLLVTALREAQEEINLQPEDVTVIGQLDEVISLHGIRVTPYVGVIPAALDLHPCEEELDSIFQVPLSWLCADPRSHTDQISVGSLTLYVPSYEWQGYRIWGLSAMMLVNLLSVGFGQPLSLYQRPQGQLKQRPVRPFPVHD